MPDKSTSQTQSDVAAVIAAAGRSTRMGESKQLLPWGERTVLESVVYNLAEAGTSPVLCVVGHRADEMITALGAAPAILVRNPDYLEREMLSSYQVGVRHLMQEATRYLGTLLALGDQPHISPDIIRQVVEQARATPDHIVIPSFELRRGHPFYLPSHLWPELLALSDDQTLRTLLQRHQARITYVNVSTDAILRDIDTPADYQALSSKNT